MAKTKHIKDMVEKFTGDEQVQPPGFTERTMDTESIKAGRKNKSSGSADSKDAAKLVNPRKKSFDGEEYIFERLSKGGSVSSASKRADGCAVKGKTKGKMV